MTLFTQPRKIKRATRHARIRGAVAGTKEIPRLAVFRSNQHIYAQLIDDDAKKTIAGANDLALKDKESMKRAAHVGKSIAQVAQKKGISRVVFDRGGFKYHGLIKALAESAREAGLQF